MWKCWFDACPDVIFAFRKESGCKNVSTGEAMTITSYTTEFTKKFNFIFPDENAPSVVSMDESPPPEYFDTTDPIELQYAQVDHAIGETRIKSEPNSENRFFLPSYDLANVFVETEADFSSTSASETTEHEDDLESIMNNLELLIGDNCSVGGSVGGSETGFTSGGVMQNLPPQPLQQPPRPAHHNSGDNTVTSLTDKGEGCSNDLYC